MPGSRERRIARLEDRLGKAGQPLSLDQIPTDELIRFIARARGKPWRCAADASTAELMAIAGDALYRYIVEVPSCGQADDEEEDTDGR